MAAESLEYENPDPIVARIQDGAYRDAVALCAEEHGAAIARFCTALLGNPGEAEEVAQEALIAAHDGMASYRGDGSVRAWLFGIARRLAARHVETQIRQERRLKLVRDGDRPKTGPDDTVARHQRAARVREALQELKPSERDAVVLRYQAGLSYREIAEACGIDEAAARKRTSRALGRLRHILKDEVQ